MLAAGPDVAGDLGELVGRREDAIVPLILEIQVVAGDARDVRVSNPAKRAIP